ncbi:MAG TPA: hypothetical protein VFB00_07710 [Terriglobales bacterium]|nr:hypothetical protein [Terriglobales bacterium]
MKAIRTRIAAGMLILAVSATELLAQQPAPPSSAPAQEAPAGQSTLPPIELPENPGASARNQSATPPQQSPQSTPAQPSGTAVAPPVEVSGGAASKPAGVAIAPPKQRQIRSLLIKLGFLAGAGVAIGTVVGLSAASPGRVPNSPGH